MTNKDRTGTARQQRRREKERAWLNSHGFTSWEKLHTRLINGDIALDQVTPAYNKPSALNQLIDKANPEMTQLSKTLIKAKKDRQS